MLMMLTIMLSPAKEAVIIHQMKDSKLPERLQRLLDCYFLEHIPFQKES